MIEVKMIRDKMIEVNIIKGKMTCSQIEILRKIHYSACPCGK
jgi:hypothetical protein